VTVVVAHSECLWYHPFVVKLNVNTVQGRKRKSFQFDLNTVRL